MPRQAGTGAVRISRRVEQGGQDQQFALVFEAAIVFEVEGIAPHQSAAAGRGGRFQ